MKRAAAVLVMLMIGCGGLTEDDPEISRVVVPVRPVEPTIAIAKDRTCVVDAAGAVRCWGSNEHDKLGVSCPATCDGTYGKISCCLSAVEIPGLADVAQVALEDEHSCALLRDGRVACWSGSAAPQLVPGLADVRQLVAGAAHTCALLGDATVRCWGKNDAGQLGDGSMEDRSAPVVVASLEGVIEIAAAWRVSCAVLGDRTARCWGSNGLHDLGPWWRCTEQSKRTGDMSCTSPREVPDVKGVLHVTASGCAITEGHTLTCWSDRGILDHHTAHGVPELGTTALFEKSWNNRCAADDAGIVRCLRFTFADLGKPAIAAIVDLHDAPRTRQLAVGPDHACVLAEDGSVRCWGDNASGQLGDGTTGPRSSPVRVRW